MKIVMVGPPGSGKGTVAAKLAKDFGFYNISAGEILREEINKGTQIGNDIKSIVAKGDLIPADLMIEMIKLDITGKDKVILDGFPRSLEQAQHFDSVGVDLVIYLEVPEEVVVERFSGRRVCESGKHGYHLKYVPPKVEGKCDIDDSALIQRPDDKPETVRDRFKVYHSETAPIVDFYKEKGVLATIDGAPLPDVVYEAVKKVVESKI
jgi:adenylate kinase